MWKAGKFIDKGYRAFGLAFGMQVVKDTTEQARARLQPTGLRARASLHAARIAG